LGYTRDNKRTNKDLEAPKDDAISKPSISAADFMQIRV
jgi:hypothetical protein